MKFQIGCIVTTALLLAAASSTRGAEESSSSFLRHPAAAESSLKQKFPSVKESACNQAPDEGTCLQTVDDGDDQQPCEWCVAGAIPSECMSQDQAAQLPEAVFNCHTPGRIVLDDEKKKVYSLQAKEHFKGVLGGAGGDGAEDSADLCDASSKSISGYMDIKGSKYDNDDEDKHLFFWMFEKRGASASASEEDIVADEDKDVASDVTIPFVVWLTGGPGCSSTLALLSENGPCKVNTDGASTKVNPYSWTESAHVLWLDQPAGVGFSYGDETDSNEEMISEDAYWFLQAFFQKYPQYATNPLFIVGESYGGHYAPAIAHRVHVGNKKLAKHAIPLHLAGLAIGNGLTDPEEQYKWYPQMVFNNSHGIKVVDEDVYDAMNEVVPRCTALIKQCNSGDSMIDTFACQTAFLVCNMGLTSPYQATGLNPYDIRIKCAKPPLCYDMSHITKFLNLESTKKALHVDEKHSHSWSTCNFGINMKFRTDWMKDFSPFVADLLDAGIPSLIYAGDVDFICNYLGNRAWTLKLDWTGHDDFTQAKEHDWKGKGLARSAKGLTWLQVYDAGHMVPSDQPENALAMITNFFNGKEF